MLRIGTCVICVVLGSSNCFGQSNDDRGDVRTHPQTTSSQPADASDELARTVASLEAANPPQPHELLSALNALGSAQFARGEFVAAETTLTEAITLAERVGANDARLASSLENLGRIALVREDYERASGWLQRSLMIVQRQEGLLHPAQIDLLDRLATAQTGARRYEDAERTLQYFIQVQEHAYGRRDVRVLPAYIRLAEWYSYMGDLDTSRLMLRRVLQMGEAHYGPESHELVRTLRALSRSYHVELVYGARVSNKYSDRELLSAQSGAASRGPTRLAPEALLSARSSASEGERAIVRAAAIAEKAQGQALSRDDRVNTLLEAGDWFAFKKQSDKSLEYYQRAWREAGGPDSAILKSPEAIFFPFIAASTKTADEAGRYATVQFSVEGDGTTTDIRILEGSATPEQNRELERAIRVARYRPQLLAGEPVKSEAMQFRYVFR